MGKNGDMFAKVIALASLFVSVVGLGSIWISIQSLKQSERASLASASQQIISDSADIDKLFIQYPEMRPFFRDRKPIRRGEEGYDRAAAIAELRVNALDTVLTFPQVFKADNWNNVARSAFRDSPIMCEFISTYKDNFSKATIQISGEACQSPAR